MAQNRQSYRRKSKKPATAVILAVLAVLSLVIWFRNRAKPAVSAEWAVNHRRGENLYHKRRRNKNHQLGFHYGAGLD